MPRVLWILIGAFLAVEMVVLTLVVRSRLTQSGFSFSRLRAISHEVHEQVGAYVPANYSGRPEDLPSVIETLMIRAAQTAVAKGQVFDPAALELMVVTSLVAHHFATRAQAEQAVRELNEKQSLRRAA